MKKSKIQLQLEIEEGDLIIFSGDESIVLNLGEISTLYFSLENIKKILVQKNKWVDENNKPLLPTPNHRE